MEDNRTMREVVDVETFRLSPGITCSCGKEFSKAVRTTTTRQMPSPHFKTMWLSLNRWTDVVISCGCGNTYMPAELPEAQ